MTCALLMPAATAAPEPADGAGAALSGVLPDLAASTSDLTTRPCGPEPVIAETSMPASLARRRASGEAKTRDEPFMARFGGATAVPVAAGGVAAAVCVARFSRIVAPAELAAGFGASVGFGAGAGAGAAAGAVSPSVSSTA